MALHEPPKLIVIDTGCFPVVYTMFGKGVTDEDVDRYLLALEDVHRKHTRFFMFVDALYGASLSAPQRRRIAQWSKDNFEVSHRFCIGAVVILNSSVMRGVITAIWWIQPPPTKHEVCNSPASGIAKMLQMFATAELSLPASFTQAYLEKYFADITAHLRKP